MYMLNNKVPRIEPCGSPAFILENKLIELFTFTLCFRSVR